MQPFQDDYVDTFSLTGSQVWALLNQQLAAGTGGIMQVSGLHFTYTGSQGSGSITGVWLGPAGDDSQPIPDDDSTSYTGTANSFMVGGGDGFTVLESAANIVQTADAELVPLVKYVGSLPDPFTYTTDGRIALNEGRVPVPALGRGLRHTTRHTEQPAHRPQAMTSCEPRIPR